MKPSDLHCSKTFLEKYVHQWLIFQREIAIEFVLFLRNDRYIYRSKGCQVLNKFWAVYAVGNNQRLFNLTFMNFLLKQ